MLAYGLVCVCVCTVCVCVFNGPVCGACVGDFLQCLCLPRTACCLETRTFLVVKLLNWLHGSCILEQPASSLMTKHPAAPAAVDPNETYKINTFLGSYRHWCPKLTSFFSNKFS